MTQIQIEYYIKTCEMKNIAQAADALYVSRSAVSRAISDLEREFHAELLTRSQNGVVPTAAGQIVYEMARNFSGSYQSVVKRIQEMEEDSFYHRIRVGITPTNGSQVYRSYLREYILQNPDKELIMTEYCASDCMEMLSQGSLDVAFVPSSENFKPGQDALFRAIPLYQNRIVFWVHKDSPLAKRKSLEIHDILDCPLGYLQAPMPMEKMLASCFEAYGKQPRLVARTSSVSMLRQMVIDGQACAIVADDMFMPNPQMVAVPLRFFRNTTNYLMLNQTIPVTDAVRHFVAAMEEKRYDNSDDVQKEAAHFGSI